MDSSISNITSTTIYINWRNYRGKNPLNPEVFAKLPRKEQEQVRDDIILETINFNRDIRKFLLLLSNKYWASLNYEEKELDNAFIIILPRQFSKLELYIEFLKEMIGFLTNCDIPWELDDLYFKFTDENEGGFIEINREEEYLKVYYLEDGKLIKNKISLVSLTKIV